MQMVKLQNSSNCYVLRIKFGKIQFHMNKKYIISDKILLYING